jgi:hypothetical protein
MGEMKKPGVLGLGMGALIALGAAFGVAFGNVAIGAMIGLVISLIFGATRYGK